MFENFQPIFEQNADKKFVPIFEKNIDSVPIFVISVSCSPIFDRSVNFEHLPLPLLLCKCV